jgi:daunorubicin resistance ABC transporter ATP-binding subunit
LTDSAIIVEGLIKRFGTVAALDGIDFEVPPATVFGLLGPNGAGKTTAIRILTTILRPDAGRALVLGRDVEREAPAVRARIGLAGQNAAVDPNLTGRENLRLIGRLAQMRRALIGPRVDELLQRFDLADAGNRPVRTYSGGMRRRLDVAAALVQRPPVLFLDEPTTGLDLQSRNGLWEMINELVGEGTTVVLTTQYLEEADRLAHDVAVVDRGVVIARGTPEELKQDLGSTVIEIGLADEQEAVEVQALVAPLVAGEPEREGTSVRLTSGDGPGVLIDVLRSLDARNVTPSRLAVREPSLDDVFLTLTGRHAEPVSEPESEAVPTGGSR